MRLCIAERWISRPASQGAQERLLPIIAAAVFDPVGQSSQCGAAIVGSDAAVDRALVPELTVAIPPPDGAAAAAAATPVLGVAAVPVLGVAARIAADDVVNAELEDVAAGMLVPATPSLVDVAAGDAVVVELEVIVELENVGAGMLVPAAPMLVDVPAGEVVAGDVVVVELPGMFVVGVREGGGA